MKRYLIGLFALALLIGCSTQELPPTPAPPAATTPASSGNIVDVTIENFAFNPSTLTINAGDQVRFTNKDSAPHTATGDSFDTGTLRQGQSNIVTFNTPGTQDYVCNIHPSMQGQIVVQ